MVEQDAARSVQAEALAIVDGDPVAVDLRYRIRGAGMERRGLRLCRLLDKAIHLRRRSLIDTRLGDFETLRLQLVGDADAGDVARQDRLLPGGFDERLRGKVVDLF